MALNDPLSNIRATALIQVCHEPPIPIKKASQFLQISAGEMRC